MFFVFSFSLESGWGDRCVGAYVSKREEYERARGEVKSATRGD